MFAVVSVWESVVRNALGYAACLLDPGDSLHIRFCGFAGALAVDTRANRSTDFLVWNNADTGVKRAEWLLPSTRTIPQDDENDQSVYAPRMVAESF